ncbi:hypothetical protein [Hydrogenimonas cancrithermarum]|uniref:Secreted protein n=1 Tax=Hydrogenimonas cancrithermarum TaxID=2993563 RepID=A0ABN6WW66_9BACT|nr:hypothetical protein [Hydrogenimonas cancrithermarum]BDY13242.1 hypothetical protein HCR_15540 [Hydrogenimonas cancrithermarum]
MNKTFIIAAIFAVSTTLMAEETVHYADTTYGPSDTVVHYDMERPQDNTKDQTNVPNDNIHPQTGK